MSVGGKGVAVGGMGVGVGVAVGIGVAVGVGVSVGGMGVLVGIAVGVGVSVGGGKVSVGGMSVAVEGECCRQPPDAKAIRNTKSSEMTLFIIDPPIRIEAELIRRSSTRSSEPVTALRARSALLPGSPYFVRRDVQIACIATMNGIRNAFLLLIVYTVGFIEVHRVPLPVPAG